MPIGINMAPMQLNFLMMYVRCNRQPIYLPFAICNIIHKRNRTHFFSSHGQAKKLERFIMFMIHESWCSALPLSQVARSDYFRYCFLRVQVAIVKKSKTIEFAKTNGIISKFIFYSRWAVSYTNIIYPELFIIIFFPLSLSFHSLSKECACVLCMWQPPRNHVSIGTVVRWRRACTICPYMAFSGHSRTAHL